MNGTRKFSDVAKEALGLELLKGISTVDVRVILEKLVTKSNGKWRFTRKPKKRLQYGERKWCLKSIMKGVVNWQGQYIVLGKARWCNRKHGAFVKRVCKLENLDDAIEEYVQNEIRGASDHAMGFVSKGAGGECRLYDNTWNVSHKLFSMQNVSSSLVSASQCYLFELIEV